MGKEMFASVLWLPTGTVPNWDSARTKATAVKWGHEGDGFTGAARDTELFANTRESELLAREDGSDFSADFFLQQTLDRMITLLESAVLGFDQEMLVIKRYGWQVFITGNIDSDESELGQLIEDLNSLGITAAAGFNPEQEFLNVLARNTRHGTNYSVHRTAEDSRQHLAADCRADWSDHTGRPGFPEVPPDDDEEAIDLFYQQEEPLAWAETTVVWIDEPGPGAVTD